jgi:hypothetical protein
MKKDIDDDYYDSEEEYVDRENKGTVIERTKYLMSVGKTPQWGKFSQLRFEKYDIPAREMIKKRLGDFVIDNPETTMQDFIINDSIFSQYFKYLEVQIKSNWNIDDPYPDSAITLYPRKLKYDDNTLFITFDKYCTRGYIFHLKNLDVKLHRKKKYSRQFVYTLPWNRAILFNSCDLSPFLLKKHYPSYLFI